MLTDLVSVFARPDRPPRHVHHVLPCCLKLSRALYKVNILVATDEMLTDLVHDLLDHIYAQEQANVEIVPSLLVLGLPLACDSSS